MEHLPRLQLVGRVIYSPGWIAALCGAVVHFSFATRMFAAVQRESTELVRRQRAVLLICTASELLALDSRSQELTIVSKRQAA
jgi:hypothetical protein